MTSPCYPEQHTPCQAWASRWVTSFLTSPDEAWNTFESAHRTAFIILQVTRPGIGEDVLIDSLIQAQMVS